MQVVARDGDHYEVRLAMDPNWLQTHGIHLPTGAHGHVHGMLNFSVPTQA
jgi:hypothetical protein